MDKKFSGTFIISGLLVGSIIGFYVIPTMVTESQTSPEEYLPIFWFRNPYNTWALILCPSHSYYQEFVNIASEEAKFDMVMSTQWDHGGINVNTSWDLSDGWNESNEQDPPCAFISNMTGTGYGLFNSSPQNLVARQNMLYTLTVWVNCTPNATIGLQWENAGGSIIYTNRSLPFDTVGMWKKFAFTVRSPPGTSKVNIILEYNGTSGYAKFDHIILYCVDTVDDSSGISPIGGTDAYSAQAIQAYWVLRSHKILDTKILLMLNSGDEDVRVYNYTINDYAYTKDFIDYKGASANKTNLIKELNGSDPFSWASHIGPRDELIVYLVGPSSKNNPDGNVTFHFENGNNITEQELDTMLRTIHCSKTVILADMDFAGNFIQGALSSAPNRMLVASASHGNQSIYWINATPAMLDSVTPQYAGSLFFHAFWDILNWTGMTLFAAFQAGESNPLSSYQYFPTILTPKNLTGPLYIDNMNLIKRWILPIDMGPLDLVGQDSWALIIAASNTRYQYNYTTYGTFDGLPTEWLSNSPKNDMFANFDLTDGQNDSGFQDPPCVKLENLTNQGYGYWYFSGLGPLTAYPNRIYTLQSWVNSTNITGTGAYLSLNFTNSSAGKSVLYRSMPINTNGIWDVFAFGCRSPAWADGVRIYLEFNGTGYAKFDGVRLWYTDNVENTTGIIPTYNSDEFPAQAIQAYWTLRSHGWNDTNIFLMINSGDNDVRIWDPAIDDYVNVSAHIDVAGNDVNKTRFLKELNPFDINSFAHKIDADDELIIYMVGQGSNNNTDGNASYHFDTGGNVTEIELENLLRQIFCPKKILLVDMNYAGNFITGPLNSTPKTMIASSGYDNDTYFWPKVTSGILLGPPAGSLFFNAFWNQLNASLTLETAFNYAKNNYIPYPYKEHLAKMQLPKVIDRQGILNTWNLDFPL
ncbi:MAG: hypothetical protein ACTSRG_07670 [Candidatus Helarchaeota archaeon]